MCAPVNELRTTLASVRKRIGSLSTEDAKNLQPVIQDLKDSLAQANILYTWSEGIADKSRLKKRMNNYFKFLRRLQEEREEETGANRTTFKPQYGLLEVPPAVHWINSTSYTMEDLSRAKYKVVGLMKDKSLHTKFLPVLLNNIDFITLAWSTAAGENFKTLYCCDDLLSMLSSHVRYKPAESAKGQMARKRSCEDVPSTAWPTQKRRTATGSQAEFSSAGNTGQEHHSDATHFIPHRNASDGANTPESQAWPAAHLEGQLRDQSRPLPCGQSSNGEFQRHSLDAMNGFVEQQVFGSNQQTATFQSENGSVDHFCPSEFLDRVPWNEWLEDTTSGSCQL